MPDRKEESMKKFNEFVSENISDAMRDATKERTDISWTDNTYSVREYRPNYRLCKKLDGTYVLQQFYYERCGQTYSQGWEDMPTFDEADNIDIERGDW